MLTCSCWHIVGEFLHPWHHHLMVWRGGGIWTEWLSVHTHYHKLMLQSWRPIEAQRSFSGAQWEARSATLLTRPPGALEAWKQDRLCLTIAFSILVTHLLGSVESGMSWFDWEAYMRSWDMIMRKVISLTHTHTRTRPLSIQQTKNLKGPTYSITWHSNNMATAF